MENRPKRRKYKDNPYTLIIDGVIYKVLFIDSLNETHLIEISRDLFDLFDSFELEDLSLMNEHDRHITDLSIDDIFYSNIYNKPKSLEEEAINNIELENLKKEISKLPEVQRHRFVLYFFYGMTLEEIAHLENCSPRAIKKSIDIALENLYRIFKK